MFRPLKEIELKVREEFEREIYRNFELGTYRDKEEIGDILKVSFSFYDFILESFLDKAASIDMLGFILSEYDYYCDLAIKQKKGELSDDESDFWDEYASKSKRALKYLAEKIVTYLPNEVDKNVDIHEALSYCFIASEEMVALYMNSQVGYSLFPDDCVLTITGKGGYNFVDFQCDKLTSAYKNLDMHNFRKKNDLSKISPFDPDIQNKFLGCVFKDNFNLDYSSTLYMIQSLIGYFEADPSESIKSFSFNRDSMIKALANDYNNHAMTEDLVSKILNGFTLSKENLGSRVLYKPKQEYRTLRRAFFEVKTNNGSEILFSKAMALEEFGQIFLSACFKKMPKEWKSLDDRIEKSLAKLSNYTGSWFEEHLMTCLEEKGIKCVRSLKKLKINGNNEYIPESVGDIDILVIVGNTLHVIECKMVQYSSEPTGYIDDMSKFVTNSKSYESKFVKKINWVEENLEKLRLHLKEDGLMIEPDIKIKPFMVTFYPTIASDFIKGFTCIDIAKYLETSL